MPLRSIKPIEVPADQPSAPGFAWDLPRRPMTAEEIVDQADTLFEAVCVQLGKAADRVELLENLAACLRSSGRESSLPLVDFDDETRRSLSVRAETIGKAIHRWAAASNAAGFARVRHGADALAGLEFESFCDGHTLRPAVVGMLSGPAGGRGVMQLYNEWLHQLILLRDILLPFDDWQAKTVPLHRLSYGRGLRALDRERANFAIDILSDKSPRAVLRRFLREFKEDETGRELGRDQQSEPSLSMLNGLLLDNDLLRVFVAVVQSGSFTAAARVLNRTQAAVSMQIKRLEEMLQLRLIERAPKLFALTSEGRTLFGFAQKMLALNEEALAHLRPGDLSGTIRVGAVAPFVHTRLPAIITAFRRRYPNVSFAVQAGLPTALLPNLGAAYDVVIDVVPRRGDHTGLFRSAALAWVGHKELAPQVRTPIPVALPAPDSEFHRWMTEGLIRQKLTWIGIVSSPSSEMLRSMVTAGHAVSAQLVDPIERDETVRILDSAELPALPDIDVIVAKSMDHAAASIDRFVEFLQSETRADHQ